MVLLAKLVFMELVPSSFYAIAGQTCFYGISAKLILCCSDANPLMV
jgi:hypothetical protein